MGKSRKSQIADVFDVPDLDLNALSHNSQFLLVSSNRDNVPHIYKVELAKTSKWIDLTSGTDRVVDGSLSSDDSCFLFPREKSGNERHNLYITDLKSYKTSLLVELDSIRVSKTSWSLDDKSVLFSGASPSSMALWKYKTSEKEVETIYETELMSYMGFVNPKKSLITYPEQSENHATAQHINIIDSETHEVVHVLSEKETSFNFDFGWNTDGNKILFCTNSPGKPTLAVWDMKSSEVVYSQATQLGLGIDYEVAKWIPKSDDIVYAAKLNGETKLYRENVSNSEKPIELPFERGWISAIEPDKNNPGLLYIAQSSTAEPTRIGRYNIGLREFDLLLHSRPAGFDTVLSDAKFLHYPTFDDWKIPAFEVPPNASASKLKGDPIIILIHGGPWWEFANGWQNMGIIIQAYSLAGFHVFCPNIRGSTGYGDEYMFCNVGDLGGNDLKDVLAAKEYVKKKYPKSKKIFLTGVSYGGFMTFLTMTKHPGVFDAGAAVVGIPDWVAMHRLGDAVFKKFTETFFNGPPEKNAELYKDRSAINFVENIKDPILIVHRANDSRCPVEPIYTFTGKAISLGKPVEIYVEQEAGHGAQKMDHLRKQYGKVIDFFKSQL